MSKITFPSTVNILKVTSASCATRNSKIDRFTDHFSEKYKYGKFTREGFRCVRNARYSE